MQDASNNTVATASYGVANELLGLTYFGINEQLTYNSMFQLIHQYAPGGVIDMQYIYTAGQNNGRIATSIDNGLPETVNYTYDSLNRLINAAATDGAFSQSYTYDGFGNLTSKSAAGFYPAYSATFNPANNQQIGVAYDANGNQTQQGTYDVSNRLVTSSIGQSYNYDYRGKRIVKRTGGTAELYFYGINGKKLTTFQCDSNLNCSSPAYNVSFAGKLVQSKGYTVATDRLGSVRWTAGPVGYVYFPYGEERTISPDDTEKFGTYTRDSSGQDYADQRYYGVGTGRFFTVDPGGITTAHPGNPTSWNRYAYVNGDPVNFGDPTGEDPCGPNQTWDGEGCIDGGDTGQDQGAGVDPATAAANCTAVDPSGCPAVLLTVTATGCNDPTLSVTQYQGNVSCDQPVDLGVSNMLSGVGNSTAPVVDTALVATVAVPVIAGAAATVAGASIASLITGGTAVGTVSTALQQTIPVIGRMADLAGLVGNAAYNVFAPISMAALVTEDVAWVNTIVQAGQSVSLQSMLTAANTFNDGVYNGGFTMFGMELGWFFNAGYTLVGGYLVPPVH
jgi:RHS repeat-associated protein